LKKILNNRGIALILVILMMSIIVAVTIAFNRSTRYEIYDAANLSDTIRLLYVAKTGFSVGEAILLVDKTGFDALTDEWADTELISATSERLFTQGNFQLRVEDETGRININKLVVGAAFNPDIKELLTRLLGLPEFRLEPEKVAEIVESIKDWLDKDEDVTGSGAENTHYATLEKAYPCKNGPLDCIEEILMIKGITPELFYGTKESPALRDCLTIYGDGKININTAPKMILRVLAQNISEEAVNRMDEYRKSKNNDLSNPAWYKNLVESSAVVIESRLLTTRSDFFRITSTGKFGNMTQTVTGVVQRSVDRKSMKMHSWKVL
jgi:general secretion pathway protein K